MIPGDVKFLSAISSLYYVCMCALKGAFVCLQRVSQNLELTSLARLASHQAQEPYCLYLPALGLQVCAQILCGF